MPTDIAIGTANLPTMGAPSLKRPMYLVTLTDGSGKNEATTYFIATDRPTFELGFIAVRGIYCNQSEGEIIKEFNEILKDSPKDAVLEMMFPAHRVKSIRSLVFNAVKPTMVGR